MKTAQEVFDEITAIKGADPAADAVQALRSYAEEVREECAKEAIAAGASNPYHAIGAEISARAIRQIEIP